MPLDKQMFPNYWEKATLAAALVTGILLCIFSARFFKNNLMVQDETIRPLQYVKFFPWNYHPLPAEKAAIPKAEAANPFVIELTNSLKKPVPVPVIPPKPQPKPEVKPQPKPQPKSEVKPVPKPEPHILTVVYRGYYVDLAGNMLGMFTLTDSRTKVTQQLQLREYSNLTKEFFISDITENDATLTTPDGNIVKLLWTQKQSFELKE